MTMFKTISNLLLLIMIGFLGYSFINKKGIFSPRREVVEVKVDEKVAVETNIGSEFSLINQDNVVVNSKDLQGKYLLVLFGFSSCKSVCPVELAMVTQALRDLEESKVKNLEVLFITVDPTRDTVEKLKEFHKNYDSRIQMLTGAPENLKAISDSYKVYVGESVNQDDGQHELDHSSIMYLMGRDGKYLAHFAPDLKSEDSQLGGLMKMLNININ